MIIFSKNNLPSIEQIKEIASEEKAVILIDKDKDWTSFDVVAKLRGILKIKKIGHSGTLDPAATGLLVLGIGKGTKALNELTGLDKTYTGQIKFGAITKTDDAEAEELDPKDTSFLNLNMIESEIKNSQLGDISQLPPKFSAKKIKGKRMYDLARKNIDFEVKPSQVRVDRFDITRFENPIADFVVECSKGTYIRSLARDLGEKLGTGGYLWSLRREKIANFDVKDSLKIEDLQKLKDESI